MGSKVVQSTAVSWLAVAVCVLKTRLNSVPLSFLLGDFIEGQANKTTLSKTIRDVSLLKEFLRGKAIDKEVESRY